MSGLDKLRGAAAADSNELPCSEGEGRYRVWGLGFIRNCTRFRDISASWGLGPGISIHAVCSCRHGNSIE